MCLEKFCGKCCEMHKNPINCFFHLVAAVIVIYALWVHSISWILIGVLIAVIGHIIQAASCKKTGKEAEKGKKKNQKKKKK